MERAGARARRRAVRELGPDLLADRDRHRRRRRPASRHRPVAPGRARRSSISASSPGSGTCGSPRRSGRRACRHGSRLGERHRRRARRGARVGAYSDARVRGRPSATARRLPACRAGLPRCGESFVRAGWETPIALPTGARLPAGRRTSGEGGIRTLDERITTRNALAGRRLQPLGHLSRVAQDIGRSGRLS